MSKFTVIFLLLVWLLNDVSGQILPQGKTSVYKVNRRVEMPITAGLFAASLIGLDQVKKKPGLDSLSIENLDPENIWKFDRRATLQDATNIEQAHTISDVVMKGTVALPVLLMLDGRMRQDWLDLLILYGQTHAVNGAAYSLTAGLYNRNRPFVYSSEIPINEKMVAGNRNSFFSGHVATTAASSFFMAKVISDYNPDLGNKKYLLFLAAMAPPSIVGIYRYKAMKHFPTDIMFGMAVGAASGILIPHFHKSKNKTGNFSFLPYAGEVSGMKVTYSIR